TRGADVRSLSSVAGDSRPGIPEALVEAIPGREGVVRARLSHLLASLSDMPAQHPALAFDRGPGFGRLLDEICPAGSVVMHGRRVPNKALALDHIAIVPRGLVVVGSDLGHALRGASSKRGTAWQSRERLDGPTRPAISGLGERRTGLVREILRRGNALRSWLDETSWGHVPVYAAACSAPLMGAMQKPPLMLAGMRLDGLWLGAVNQLPEWLASGGAFDHEACAALGNFLAAELPVG
ncbi:MAG TPA: hypothetical protein VMS00_04620, partial [Acidimicrobiales bacterium]|nr:hypothetical protein [Acidimicrobiales bacterium]